MHAGKACDPSGPTSVYPQKSQSLCMQHVRAGSQVLLLTQVRIVLRHSDEYRVGGAVSNGKLVPPAQLHTKAASISNHVSLAHVCSEVP